MTLLAQLSDLLTTVKAHVNIPLEYYYHWLPRMKLTPTDLRAMGFPQTSDLLDGVLIGIFFTILRFFLERLVFVHFGRCFMKHKYYNMAQNETLEAALREDRFPKSARIGTLAKQIGWKQVDVSAYFRRARNRQREEKVMVKFTEVSWKFLTHLYLTCFGAWAVLFHERWMWSYDSCWENYPYYPITKAVYWYYMSEFGTFSHEMLTLFIETRRSDFWAMFTHHVATLLLIFGSYACYFLPIGSLVMITHDVADLFLEIAKIFNYMCKARPWAQKVTDFFFVVFAVTFFLSRLVLFPIHIWWRNSVMTPMVHFGYNYLGVQVLNCFLFVLICLHSYWMYLIIKMAVKMAAAGKAEKDHRSDDDEDFEDSEGEKDD